MLHGDKMQIRCKRPDALGHRVSVCRRAAGHTRRAESGVPFTGPASGSPAVPRREHTRSTAAPVAPAVAACCCCHLPETRRMIPDLTLRFWLSQRWSRASRMGHREVPAVISSVRFPPPWTAVFVVTYHNTRSALALPRRLALAYSDLLSGLFRCPVIGWCSPRLNGARWRVPQLKSRCNKLRLASSKHAATCRARDSSSSDTARGEERSV